MEPFVANKYPGNPDKNNHSSQVEGGNLNLNNSIIEKIDCEMKIALKKLALFVKIYSSLTKNKEPFKTVEGFSLCYEIINLTSRILDPKHQTPSRLLIIIIFQMNLVENYCRDILPMSIQLLKK